MTGFCSRVGDILGCSLAGGEWREREDTVGMTHGRRVRKRSQMEQRVHCTQYSLDPSIHLIQPSSLRLKL